MIYKAVVIGASAGGMEAISNLLKRLKPEFILPIMIVQHTSPSSDNYFIHYIQEKTPLKVKEATSGDKITGGFVFVAPPNYHMLVEKNKTLTLSTEEKVNYSRPSIDVLFNTAAEVYYESLIGIILTGASSDGSLGLKRIKQLGGYCIVQNPQSAESKPMPEYAIDFAHPDKILNIKEISDFLNNL